MIILFNIKKLIEYLKNNKYIFEENDIYIGEYELDNNWIEIRLNNSKKLIKYLLYSIGINIFLEYLTQKVKILNIIIIMKNIYASYLIVKMKY